MNIYWWKNGALQGEFPGHLDDEAVLLEGDGLVVNVPRNRIVRRERGRVTVIDLRDPDHHLSRTEISILVNGLLRSLPGKGWTWPEILQLVGHPNRDGKHVRTLVNRWFQHLRAVLQDSRHGPFLRLDRFASTAASRYARYLDPAYEYVLIDYEQGGA